MMLIIADLAAMFVQHAPMLRGFVRLVFAVFLATLVTTTVTVMLRTVVKEPVRAVIVQNARLGMVHPVFPSQTAQLVHLIVILVRTMLVPEVLAHIRR